MDNIKNFAVGELSGTLSSSATSLTLATGQGSRFPTAPFNAVIWDSTNYSDAAMAFHAGKAEIVRVTAVTGDTFTIERAQEGTTAVAFLDANAIYKVALGVTKKTVDDIVNSMPSEGMTAAERATMNDIIVDVAENAYRHNLDDLVYDDGMFDIFANLDKISGNTNTAITTLDDADLKGKACLAEDLGSGEYGEQYNVSTLSSNVNSDVAKNDGFTYTAGICLSPDGTKLFIAGVCAGKNTISRYDLSTPFDISTASTYYHLDVNTYIFSVSSVWFNSDGSKMYVLGQSQSSNKWAIATYNCVNNNYDNYGATFSSIHDLPNDPPTNCNDMHFKSDGLKLFVITYQYVYEYNLSVAYDMSTLSYVRSVNIYSYAEENDHRGLAFSHDGTKMIVTGTVNQSIYEYDLSVAYDISTLSYVRSAALTGILGIFFNSDGTMLFTVDNDELIDSWDVGEMVYPYYSTGDITSSSKVFNFVPSKVVISHDADVPEGASITYDIIDQYGHTVNVANIDEEVVLTGITGNEITIKVNFVDEDTATTPALYSYACFFKE